MIKVLHVFHHMGNGGIEHFVMDNYAAMDKSQIHFDFLVSVDYAGGFDEEIAAMGSKMYRAYPFKKNPIKNYNEIAQIVKDNHYDIIHRHTGSAFGYFDLRAARKGGAKQLILHSHNPDVGKIWVHKLSKQLLEIDCIRLACSKEAGEFLFGQKPFEVFPNAIDCEQFRFSPSERERVRKELGVENEFVLGHIGRYEEQKNHKKLVEILKAVLKLRPKSKLISVGDGILMQDVKDYAKKLGVYEKILFLGYRKDVASVMQAFDVFVLPSLYEGFGIVQIEAQANGLKCFSSKGVIPREANITGNVKFIPLANTAEQWAEKIVNTNSQRDYNAIQHVIEEGFDIHFSAERLTNFYQSLIK